MVQNNEGFSQRGNDSINNAWSSLRACTANASPSSPASASSSSPESASSSSSASTSSMNGCLGSIEMNGEWQSEHSRWLRRASLSSGGCCEGVRCQRSSPGKENIDPALFASTTTTTTTTSSSSHPASALPSSSPPTPATPMGEPALPSSAEDHFDVDHLQNN